MTMTSSGGSPERGVSTPIKNEESGRELQIIHRRIFLEACNFMTRFRPHTPFDLYFPEASGRDIIGRTIDLSVGGIPILERPEHFQLDEERKEHQKREEEINRFIRSYSGDTYFSRGVNLIRGFVMGLRPYLDGTGRVPQIDPNNIRALMTIGGVEVVITEVNKHLTEDSTGLSLVRFVSNILQKECVPNISMDDSKKKGLMFGEKLFRQAIIDYTDPYLSRLAQLQPGDKPVSSETPNT